MLAVLSPAKKLDFDPVPADIDATLPQFQTEANKLARIARDLSADELRRLMSISEDLAQLNQKRFKAFQRASRDTNSKQAMLAFAGDTYQGLQAGRFKARDRDRAQDRLRILSGLYGVLRPLDRIQPYRLEMGSRLANDAGSNLYAFWGAKVAKALDKASGKAPIVNLASAEYFKAVDRKALKSPVIEVDFREERNGELKMIGFFAKRARGTMARFMIQNEVDTPEALTAFDLDGYGFRKDLSDESRLVFTRAAG